MKGNRYIWETKYWETMTARISRYVRTRQVRGQGGLIQRPGGSEVGEYMGF